MREGLLRTISRLLAPRWRPGTFSLILAGASLVALGAMTISIGEGWYLP